MIQQNMEQIAAGQPFSVLEYSSPNENYKAFQFTVGTTKPFLVMVTKSSQPLHVASVVKEGTDTISFALTPWGAMRGAIIKHLGGLDATE